MKIKLYFVSFLMFLSRTWAHDLVLNSWVKFLNQVFCSLFSLTENIYEWTQTDYDKATFLLPSWTTSYKRNRTSLQIPLGCSVILATKSRGSACYLFPVMLLIWLQNSFLLCEEMSALSCNILPCCKKPYWIKYKELFFFFSFLFYVNLFCVSSETNLVTVTASSYAGLSLLGKSIWCISLSMKST